jgi:N-acetylmuramoyl-L-alanine amidase
MGRVVLDAGHGGFDTGIIVEGLREKDVTLAITLGVGKILAERGHDVAYTHSGDTCVGTGAVQRLGATSDAFLSVHLGVALPEVRGVRTIVVSPFEHKASVHLADRIRASVVRTLLLPNCGMRYERLATLLHGRMHASVHVELGFITNAFDRAVLADSISRRHLYVAVAGGIQGYLEDVGL